MNIASAIVAQNNTDVIWVTEKNTTLHGEAATQVDAQLVDGRLVTGTFTTESKPGFGGVEFAHRKDIPALMTAKIKSVLAGTADAN